LLEIKNLQIQRLQIGGNERKIKLTLHSAAKQKNDNFRDWLAAL